MTDRLQCERELPEGYQFGDAHGWNTIEADHAPQHEHRHYYAYDIGVDLFVCACGAHETTHIGFDPASKRTWEP